MTDQSQPGSLAPISGKEEQRRRLLEKLKRELGPIILAALDDPKVIEVMLNPDGSIWLDRLGEGMSDTGEKMRPVQAENLLGTIAAMLDTVVNRENPILEGELPLDGSRFEGLLPPLVASASFTIRKKALMIFTLADYVRDGIMTQQQADKIKAAVKNRENILVVGSTGSGKTTLVNAVLEEISKVAEDQRIVIIEDTVELQCAVKNKVELRTSDAADMTRLLRATMRLRPDRICVGETRGPEALALLKAWNTGHPGGVATVHAESALDGLYRIDELIQEGGVPSKAKLISRAMNVVIFIEKENGSRKVKELLAVKGYDSHNEVYLTEDI